MQHADISSSHDVDQFTCFNMSNLNNGILRSDNLATGSTGSMSATGDRLPAALHSSSGGFGSQIESTGAVGQQLAGIDVINETDVVRDRVTFDVIREIPKQTIIPQFIPEVLGGEVVRAEAVTVPTGTQSRESVGGIIGAVVKDQRGVAAVDSSLSAGRGGSSLQTQLGAFTLGSSDSGLERRL